MATTLTPTATSALDVQHLSLLNALQEEVERLRKSERHQSEENEKASRESKRTTVLLQLSQDQLQGAKETNLRLQNELHDTKEKLKTAEHQAATARETAVHAEAVVLATRAELQEKLEKQKVETELAARRTVQEREANEILRKEIHELEVRLMKEKHEREEDSRLAFERRVALETRLKSKTTELSDLEHLREKELKESVAREFDLSKLVRELTAKRDEVQGILEAERKSSFLLIATLKSESQSSAHKTEQVTATWRSAEQDLMQNNETLKRQLEQVKERLSELETSSQARIKVLEAQNAKFCADLRAAQSEINLQADREDTLNRDKAEAMVMLHARHDATKLRNEELEEELRLTKERLRQAVISSAAERDEIKLKHESTLSKQKDLTYNASQTLQHVEMDKRVLQARVHALESELEQALARSSKLAVAQANDITSLKAEMEGYRNAVSKLEQHIAENYEVRILQDHNEQLNQELARVKALLQQANHTLADVRIEASISESYRLKMVQEDVETQLARVAALEKERAAARPLIGSLVELAKRREVFESPVALEVDTFYRHFGNSSS